MPFIQTSREATMSFEPSQRVKALPPYIFVELARRKRALVDAGHDVIELGIGDPERPTYPFIVDRLKQAAEAPANHRYTLLYGCPGFRRQAAEFFERRYGVSLDPDNEMLTLIGSKEGIGHLPLAVVDPGRGVLIPNPGYPAYRATTLFAGGVPHDLPLTEENGWLPDLEAVPGEVARNAVLMYLNYPNNPTGACGSLEFFERALAFARKHEIILAHDAAYNEMYFGDERPPSVLQLPGAREIAIEFHSTSKTFNMTGWRIAFAAGSSDVLAALGKIKSNIDSGQFAAVQEAGTAAYAGFDRPELHESRAMYHARARLLAAGLREAGFRVAEPRATFYVWAAVPDGHDSTTAAARLLEEAHVVGVPGHGFGSRGAGYIRFAVTVDLERTRAALERIKGLEW
jgi:LL-diaminopimelate aminotransferase